MKTKINVAFLLLLFLTVLFPLGIVLSQDQLEENTVFTIEVPWVAPPLGLLNAGFF